jgi:hypothetical protein
MECLGPRQLLGADPDTILFERSGGINSGTADCNVGDEGNSGRANSGRASLLEASLLLFRSALDQFRCSLSVRTGSGFGSSLSDPAISPLVSGTIRCPGNKHRSLDRRFPGHLERIHGHGPFSGGTAEQNTLSIQIFLIVLSIPMLFLAAVIEERATGETERRESESRFRIVADAAPVLIWMAGVDKLCTFFNKPWLKFTGRSLEQEWEWLGRRRTSRRSAKMSQDLHGGIRCARTVCDAIPAETL